jgi:hypothetical protein
MTQKESNPEDSAATAVSTMRSNIRSVGTARNVKLGSCRPRCVTMLLPSESIHLTDG